jgi:hypothetical protein
MKKTNALRIGVAFFTVVIMIFSATAISIENREVSEIKEFIDPDENMHKIPPSDWADLQVLTENLCWSDVTPGDTVTGDIAIFGAGWQGKYIGWMITDWPDWGNWTFNPINGTFPLGHTFHVGVTAVVPDEENATFGGFIRVQNTHNPDNYDDVYITLSTALDLEVVAQNQQSGNLQVSQFSQKLVYHFQMFGQSPNLR